MMQSRNSEDSTQSQGTQKHELIEPTMEDSQPVANTHFGRHSTTELGVSHECQEKLGPFRLGHQVSHSETSSVFKGTSLVDGRSVMLKIPTGWGHSADVAAKDEYRALRKLQGPGVAAAVRVLKWGNRSVLVTETLQRRSFISKVRGATPVGLLPNLNGLTGVFSQLLTTLNRIHNLGWVHGAIGAEHILFNELDVPVLIDFSSATKIHCPGWCPPKSKLVANSPYLAPELICSPPDKPASDMFAVGRLLAYSLSGSMPRWFPGEAMTVSDLRLQTQLPVNTPRYLVDLCAKLVRMAPVQRPTAAMALQMLNGADIDQTAPSKKKLDASSKSCCLGSAKILEVSRNCFLQAAQGKGAFHVLTVDNHQTDQVEAIFHNTPYDDARLILSSVCDADEQSTLAGFDSLFDLLAIWFKQLAPTLQAAWQRRNYPALRFASESLSQALGQPQKYVFTPTDDEVKRASQDVIRLLVDLSQQRTLVLLFHQFDQFDAASARVLSELVKLTPSLPIIIACTTTAKDKVARNPHVAHLLEQSLSTELT